MTDSSLHKVTDRLYRSLHQEAIVQKTTDYLREFLQVDRVVLYYFFRPWKGRVTFESLSSSDFSIVGKTGPDECFNGEYAALYLAGRVRAIADIESAVINPCHRDFLRSLQVRANLCVPIINGNELWGLLIAHHCQDIRPWLPADIEMMQKAAETLATAAAIRNSERL